MLGDSYFSFKNNNDLKLNSFFSIFLVSINTFAFFGLPSYSFEKNQDELEQKKPKIPTKDTIKVLSYKVGLYNNLDILSHVLSIQFILFKKTFETIQNRHSLN